MRKKRKIFPLIFVLFWVFLFSLGLSQVFLYLQGYNPFSLFDKKEIQKGYATFSSLSLKPLFLDGEYLGKGFFYGRYKLGEYSLCVESLGYESKCYSHVSVKRNDYASAQREGIFLSYRNKEEKTYFWTSEPLYRKNNGDFFWYDKEKNQVFFVEKMGEGVLSFFPKNPINLIHYDEEKKRYILEEKNKKGGAVHEFVPFSSYSSFSEFSFEKEEGLKDVSIVYSHEDYEDMRDGNEKIKIILDEKPDQVVSFGRGGGAFVVFDSSLYFFSLLEDELSFFTSLKSDSKILFVRKTGDLFFQTEEGLWSVNVL